MARIDRHVSIVAALIALGGVVGGGREARAELSLGLTKGGIVQVGGGGAGTDPPYTYQFEADYTGKLTAWPSTSFTVDNLVGVYPLDLTGTGPSGWIYSITPVSGPSWNYPYFTSDVTWTYIGLPMLSSGNGTGSTDLGIFQITTQSNFAGGYPAVLPTSVDYSLSINGGPSTPGGSPVELIEGGITAAPEPSTLIAPLMVLLSLPVFRLLKRRIPRGQATA